MRETHRVLSRMVGSSDSHGEYELSFSATGVAEK